MVFSPVSGFFDFADYTSPITVLVLGLTACPVMNWIAPLFYRTSEGRPLH
jgi:hypothetical protein